ncbi:MAG: AzlC family ABC transporter permease [Lachnospiraceae bacterium]|nr:AzlC family ABC transporter permease [Lachnospiraceae bacterium]
MKRQDFQYGLRDGVPIALGYFSVSFSFGIMALKGGLSVLQAAITSLTNMTSAGQFAGLQIIIAGGTLLEMAATQLIINLRYALMSLSLSQKLSGNVTLWQRFIIAFANTDEIFAVAMSHNRELTFSYMVGLQILPIIGWTSGTACGAVAGSMLPAAINSALSVALYGMFLAVVIPAAKKTRPVLLMALLAAAISCILYYVPLFQGISAGMSIIICTVAASVVGAIVFPVKEEGGAK